MKTETSHDLLPKRDSSGEPRFVISSVYRQLSARTHIWRPPTDVFETSDDIIVKVEIAGMRDSEFTISLEKRILAIRGTRLAANEQGAYYQLEINTGDFLSLVELLVAVDYDQIQADYTDGYLTVVLPKMISRRVDVNQG